ncbi:MAG: FAD:protein FMN transferase [Anaerotignum sp.]
MNLKKWIALGLTGCFLFSGCAEQREQAQAALENSQQENRYEATSFAMDTVMTFTIIHEDGEELLIDAEQEVRRLENLFSVTAEQSEIAKLNTAAGKEPVQTSNDTQALLQAGKELGKATNGAFDIAISPIVKVWGFTEEEHSVPSQETIDSLLPLTDPEGLILEGGTAYLEKEGMAVDLGGIAKGYASDSVKALLKEKGVESALLSLGGNICTIGSKPDGSPWKTAVQNPLDANDYVGLLEISDTCVITSGGYQRYFEENGKRYHHIIDPATGWPAESGLLSVTIVCESGTKADALSTALFVMGLEDALAYWRTQDDFEVIFVTEDGEVVATEGLQDSFAFEGKDNDFTYRVAER